MKTQIQKNFFSIKRICYILVAMLVMSSCINKKKQTEEKVGDLKYSDIYLNIIKNTAVPKFKETIYNILEYQAIGDGKTICTKAIEKAIKTCSENGGGIVLVPKGDYLTGPIHLENNVNLHLEDGAQILFTTNPDDYYPLVHTSFEGIELMNYSPLIYAYKKNNIAITGNGILNGQANETNWWPWKGSDSEGHTYGFKKGQPSQKDSLNLPVLMDMGQNAVPVEKRIFGKGHYLRPNFIEPFECTNVLIKGVKIINAPFWIIHPIKSTNVTVDGVTVESHGPNNDGCDPEYSKNVVIKNCIFNTGDDCIAIKAGRDAEGRRVAIKSENIVVQNCKMIDGHGGVVIGSEMSAGVKNVFVYDCSMDSPNLERAIRIKTNTRRGGTVEGVYVKNLKVGQVKEAVLKINMHYGVYENQTGDFIPEVRNIIFENVSVKNGGKYAILANGLENSIIENILFKNVRIEKVNESFSLEHVSDVKFIDTYINNQKIENNLN